MTTNYCFPDWQSSGDTRELHHGALLLRSLLAERCSFVDIQVDQTSPLDLHDDVLGHSAIVAQLRQFSSSLKLRSPLAIFTVGGTCGMEVIPVSYLNQAYDGDLAVIWFDAHGDLNTPSSSPSNCFHGMPLRLLLGDGNESLLELLFSVLTPSQVILAGARDLDEAEESYIEQERIKCVSPKQLVRPENLLRAVKDTGFSNVYVHFDFDVLDPVAYPHVFMPVANGVSQNTIRNALERLRKKYRVVGASMVEWNPQNDPHPQDVLELYEAIKPQETG